MGPVRPPRLSRLIIGLILAGLLIWYLSTLG